MSLKNKFDDETIAAIDGAVKALESIGARSLRASMYVMTLRLSNSLNAGLQQAFMQSGLKVESMEEVMKSVTFDPSKLNKS